MKVICLGCFHFIMFPLLRQCSLLRALFSNIMPAPVVSVPKCRLCTRVPYILLINVVKEKYGVGNASAPSCRSRLLPTTNPFLELIVIDPEL